MNCGGAMVADLNISSDTQTAMTSTATATEARRPAAGSRLCNPHVAPFRPAAMKAATNGSNSSTSSPSTASTLPSSTATTTPAKTRTQPMSKPNSPNRSSPTTKKSSSPPPVVTVTAATTTDSDSQLELTENVQALTITEATNLTTPTTGGKTSVTDELEDEGLSIGHSSACDSDSFLTDDDSDSKESDDSGHHEAPTTVVINGKQMDISSERYAVLSFEQVMRLDRVMDELMPIHGRGNFPTLEIRLKDLVQVVRSKLQQEQIEVRDIRLNGGAASYVLSTENPRHRQSYTDLDLIFDLSDQLDDPTSFDRVRTAVLESLLDFLPEGVATKRISSCTLKEAYVHKMVKVTEGGDRWSLISLCNHTGRDVELKFVSRMRRQFEFSVDSFQIILDSLLRFYECESPGITRNFFPTVVGESVFGNFQEALSHLQRKIVATRNPEEIRGGGLLKYCRLLVMGYKAQKYEELKNLERYMCSRFFIDFSDLQVQRIKLEGYLTTHFQGDDATKYDYLTILHRVMDASTVCLMGHERRQTLSLIEELAYHFYYQDQQRQLIKHQYQQVANHQTTVANTQPHTHHAHSHQHHNHHPHPHHNSPSNHHLNSQQTAASQSSSGHHQQLHSHQQLGPPPPPPTHHTTAYVMGAGQHIYYTPYHPSYHHHVNCFNCHCGGWMTCA